MEGEPETLRVHFKSFSSDLLFSLGPFQFNLKYPLGKTSVSLTTCPHLRELLITFFASIYQKYFTH